VYYVLARADGDSVVPETNENNNMRADAVAIGPDLVVSVFTVPATAAAGSMISVNDTTRNQGAGAAPASTTSFYLSTNSAFDGADLWLGSRAVASLAAGVASTAPTTLTIPLTATAGNYYIIARADGDLLVPETNENNNVRGDSVSIGPDLVVSVLTAPAAAVAGATISVSDTTRNQGGGAAPASSTMFYLSTNTAFDAADVPLGARAVAELAASATSAASTSLEIPPTTLAGVYYVLARADGDLLVPETNENNNVRAARVTVSAP
jgi:subtilase family serine protease